MRFIYVVVFILLHGYIGSITWIYNYYFYLVNIWVVSNLGPIHLLYLLHNSNLARFPSEQYSLLISCSIFYSPATAHSPIPLNALFYFLRIFFLLSSGYLNLKLCKFQLRFKSNMSEWWTWHGGGGGQDYLPWNYFKWQPCIHIASSL